MSYFTTNVKILTQKDLLVIFCVFQASYGIDFNPLDSRNIAVNEYASRLLEMPL